MIEYIVLAGAAAIFLLVLAGLGLLLLSRARKSKSLGLPAFPFPTCRERVTLLRLFEKEARKLERRRRRKKLEEMLSGLFDPPKEGG